MFHSVSASGHCKVKCLVVSPPLVRQCNYHPPLPSAQHYLVHRGWLHVSQQWQSKQFCFEKRWGKKWVVVFFRNQNTWNTCLFKVILLLPLLNPTEMGNFVFLVYHSLIHLKMCSQWYDRHVIKQVTLWKVLLLQRDKNMYSYYHSFKKSVKLKRGSTVCGRATPGSMTPCYCDSFSLVSTHSCLQTQTRWDKWAFQLQRILPARDSPGSSGEKGCQSLHDQKLFSFFPRFNTQKSISIFQQALSIQRNTKIQTL